MMIFIWQWDQKVFSSPVSAAHRTLFPRSIDGMVNAWNTDVCSYWSNVNQFSQDSFSVNKCFPSKILFYFTNIVCTNLRKYATDISVIKNHFKCKKYCCIYRGFASTCILVGFDIPILSTADTTSLLSPKSWNDSMSSGKFRAGFWKWRIFLVKPQSSWHCVRIINKCLNLFHYLSLTDRKALITK